jgi:hypothetical protein
VNYRRFARRRVSNHYCLHHMIQDALKSSHRLNATKVALLVPNQGISLTGRSQLRPIVTGPLGASHFLLGAGGMLIVIGWPLRPSMQRSRSDVDSLSRITKRQIGKKISEMPSTLSWNFC